MGVAVESQTYVMFRFDIFVQRKFDGLVRCLVKEPRPAIATRFPFFNMHGMPVRCNTHLHAAQRWVTCRPMPEKPLWKPLAKLTAAVLVTNDGNNTSHSLQAVYSSIWTCYMNMPTATELVSELARMKQSQPRARHPVAISTVQYSPDKDLHSFRQQSGRSK